MIFLVEALCVYFCIHVNSFKSICRKTSIGVLVENVCNKNDNIPSLTIQQHQESIFHPIDKLIF